MERKMKKSVKGLLMILLVSIMVFGSAISAGAKGEVSVNSDSAGLILEGGDHVCTRAAGGYFVYVDRAYGDTTGGATYTIKDTEWVLGEWESYKVLGMTSFTNANGDLAVNLWVKSIAPFEQAQTKIRDAVTNAPKNGEVIVNTGSTVSINPATREVLEKRTDVTLTLNFNYKGTDYTVTIPAGTDWKAVAGNNSWIGFMYLNALFQGKEGTSYYDEVVLENEYETLADMYDDLSDALETIGENGSLTIDTGKWFMMGPDGLAALQERNDVEITLIFEYGAKHYTVTIPSGEDWSWIAGDSKWVGFMYLNAIYKGHEI